MIWCVSLNPALDVVLEMAEPLVAGRVHRAEFMEARLGGKGNNVARIIKALGGNAAVVGIYGGAVGQSLVSLAEEEGLPLIGEWVPDDSRICMTVVDGTDHITEIRPPGPVVDYHAVCRLLDRIRSQVGPEDWVTLSGSLPPGVPDNTYARWIEILSPSIRGVLVDTSGRALQESLRVNPAAVVPNAEEYAAIQKEGGPAGSTQIIVTQGDRGLTWFDTSGHRRSWVPAAVDVRNTVGAGDAFLGGLVTQLDKGVEWEQAIPWGMAVATASVETLGVADVDPARVPIIYQKIMEVPSC